MTAKLPSDRVVATRLAVFGAVTATPQTFADVCNRSGFGEKVVRAHLREMLASGVVELAPIAGLKNAGWKLPTSATVSMAVVEADPNALEIAAWLTSRKLIDAARAVVAEHGATLAEVCSRSRQSQVVEARQELWRALEETGMSQSAIGRLFKRDHSTVHHGITQAEKRRMAALDAQEGQAAE